MQTNLAANIKQGNQAQAIEAILRKCVHCGFCNATCPTYQLRGDELDGPRGRIYQMKQFFEGEPANVEMRKHLDRCLTCRSCETTCPSGVRYSHLLEMGRQAIDRELPRPLWDRIRRWVIVNFITSGGLFTAAVRISQSLAWMMPNRIRRSLPLKQQPVTRTASTHTRKMLMLAGCVQPVLAPNTNIKAANLLDRLGIEVIEPEGTQCCGAAAVHTSAPELGLRQARQLIDSWWPHVEAGVEAIVVTATGCGLNVSEYDRLLADDPVYADKARRVSSMCRDLVELLEMELEAADLSPVSGQRVAVHTPCTMQHGLGINHRVERLLASAGHEICGVEDGHLCCGSAGTYSMLQPELANQLRHNKISALSKDRPEVIATANIGCQLHLSQVSAVPVVHWVELL